MHSRIARERGKATHCSIDGCASGSQAFHWAYVSGTPNDVSNYRPMCAFHHRAFDWAQVLGMTVPEALERISQIPARRQKGMNQRRAGRP
jgi:hypothetical protein